MRCYICDKDADDKEIKIERKADGGITFGPCSECRTVISNTVITQQVWEEEAPTLPLWDIE